MPLDPESPPARLALILADVEPAMLVTSGRLARTAPASVPVTFVEELAEAPAPDPAQAYEIAESDYAYAIFTSGTTGRPKGVAITHANAIGLFTAADQVYDLGPDDVWTMTHSFAFDYSVWEIWGALLSGGCVVVVSSEDRAQPGGAAPVASGRAG